MRFHWLELIGAVGTWGPVAAFSWMAGCVATSAQVTSPSEGSAPQSRTLAHEDRQGGPDLCGPRPRCAVLRRERVSDPAVELVVLRLAHAPGASSDEDRCDHREYWIVHTERNELLARDCEVQWGADNLGPATLHLDRGRASLKYVAFESNDNCEIYQATVSLASLTVESQERWEGSSRGDRCERLKQAALPPLGDGSITQPLLELHP
jgi:hypothetical protein